MNSNFIYGPRAKKAFTLVETLLAVTILMMVFNIFYFYMQSQNRQILTLVQKNEVEEVANFAMQYLSNDIKSARRGSVVITPSSLTLDRFIE
ncbi:MAG TPA: prepilin-type N-terminal cleavage/methylation domain-containing protein, partial [Candidatus Wallbacteria bacterium]|nr:prepilin-type N-terminal cleavage/methylation domain-containing protein [Candidatus Wallbacteria bacterium]